MNNIVPITERVFPDDINADFIKKMATTKMDTFAEQTLDVLALKQRSNEFIHSLRTLNNAQEVSRERFAEITEKVDTLLDTISPLVEKFESQKREISDLKANLLRVVGIGAVINIVVGAFIVLSFLYT